MCMLTRERRHVCVCVLTAGTCPKPGCQRASCAHVAWGAASRAPGSFFCLSLREGDLRRSEFCPDLVTARQKLYNQIVRQMNGHCRAAGVAGGSDGLAVSLCLR